MRKSLFVLFLTLGMYAYAQFTLNPEGKFLDSESKKEYKVFPLESKKKAELFAMVKTNITLYAKTSTILNESDSDAISIIYDAPYQRGRNRINMRLKMNFAIKDGRIRVSGIMTEVSTPPVGGKVGNIISALEVTCSASQFLNGKGNFRKRFRVWGDDGNLISQENLDAYSNVFNSLVNKVVAENKEEAW